MDYELKKWLGRWQILAWDHAAPVGYEEAEVASFADPADALIAWAQVMKAIA